MKTLLFILSGSLIFLSVSCAEMETGKNHGPIVLGDSATIITETDSAFLRDMVMDMEVRQQPADQPEPKTEPRKEDTVVTVTTPPVNKEANTGFTIDFGTVKMELTGIKTTAYQKQDPVKDAGVSYACTEGDITESSIIISNAKDIRIQQRYQTKLGLKSSLGNMLLPDLGIFTSEWVDLRAQKKAGHFHFDLNDLKKADFKKISNNSLKHALRKELRRQRASSSAVQQWLSAIRKTRNADDAPCHIILYNVQWRISGTDSRGRRFYKTIRLDAKAV